uniref:BPTI/Kunitz inhibitor domain-containing protein n=1 Tax=Heliothis virescens TaxID=7102 RepID=A0A2A4JSQ2_HELVI
MSKLLIGLIAMLLISLVTSQTLLPGQPQQQQAGRARCQMPIDTGSCGVILSSILSNPTQRYAYDRRSRGCVQFTFSGCGGNRNNFVSYSRCMTTCNPAQTTINQIVNLVQYALTGQSGQIYK